jgi:ribonuclease D
MNEQIKKLAEQANPDFAKFYIVGPWHAEDIEKFAELIVRECIDTAFHRGHSDLEFLLKHFGVGE